MKRLIWIDDIRDPFKADWLMSYAPEYAYGEGEVVWVKDYNEFIDEVITNGLPDKIAFDHDLGEGNSGMDCAKWLVSWCMDKHEDLPEWTIQSDNPAGKENINSLLSNYLKFKESENEEGD